MSLQSSHVAVIVLISGISRCRTHYLNSPTAALSNKTVQPDKPEEMLPIFSFIIKEDN